MAGNTNKKGGVISTKFGPSPKITKKKTTAGKWMGDLRKSFNRGTQKWRYEVINLKPQVIVLSKSALTMKDTHISKRTGKKSPTYGQNVLGDAKLKNDPRSDDKIRQELRKFAKSWVKAQTPKKGTKEQPSVEEKVHEFNLENVNNPTFHYIVVFNWNEAGKFFKAAIAKGLLKEGVTHRGHDTAAIRYHIGSEVDKLKGFAARGAGAERVARSAALQLKIDLTAVEQSISPVLTIRQTMNINAQLASKGLTEILILVPQVASMNVSDKTNAQARAARKRIVQQFWNTHKNDVLTLSGSKTYIQALNESIDDLLMDKKTKTYRARKTTTNRPKQSPVGAKLTAAKPPRLRTSQGKFTSAMNIQAILDAKIKETVADNMGKGGALVYRTGRFAQSVGVEKVMQSRQGTLTAFYTYMKAPYQTFERGFKQGSLRRDPRKLISASIREIARETLNHKLQIRTRRV